MSKFVMPTVTFVEDYEPTSKLGRVAEDNPFNEIVAALILSWDDSIKRTTGAAKLVIPPGMTRTQVTHKFGQSANPVGYSYRADDKANETINLGTDKKPEMVSCGVVTVYLVPLITRTRKSRTITFSQVPYVVNLVKAA